MQFWDTATNRLKNAASTTYDTLFGCSFSPDGKLLAFGAADNSARVISVPDGKEVLKLDNHGDWVLGTAFSRDGKDLVTASRDQAIKLTVVENGSSPLGSSPNQAPMNVWSPPIGPWISAVTGSTRSATTWTRTSSTC